MEQASAMKYKPAFGPVKGYDDFFKLLERIRVDKVDVKFLQTEKIASGNERKIVNGLKFLDLIDENGNSKENMKSLYLKGEDFAKSLGKAVRDAYSVLVEKVDIQKATTNDIVNSLQRDYGMAPSTANQGACVFLFLANKAGLPLSLSLAEESTGLQEKPKKIVERPPKTSKQSGQPGSAGGIGAKPEGNYALIPEGLHESRWGNDTIIFLKKGDRAAREKIANTARKLIDMYVEEEET